MNSELKASILSVFQASLYVLAVIGALSAGYWVRCRIERPQHSATPNSFLIVAVYKASSDAVPTTRIYLNAPSSSQDLKFDGVGLTHRFQEVSHWQSAVPLSGVIVVGKGTILFGSAELSVDNGNVKINGLSVCPREVTVTRNGNFEEGPIGIAE
jgi:hypothetical protein